MMVNSIYFETSNLNGTVVLFIINNDLYGKKFYICNILIISS